MIIKLELQNFKSLIDNEINLAPLTFFTGLNSSGKSSFLQALRLLAGEQREILEEFNNLGGFISKGKKSFSLKASAKTNQYNFTHPDTAKNKLFNTKFAYLSAARLGPHLSLSSKKENLSGCGSKGENTLSFLIENESLKIDKAIQQKSKAKYSNTLDAGVQGWLQHISPDTTLNYRQIKEAFTDVARFDEFNPVHVGFGLSYTLPVIANLLAYSTKEFKGGLLLLENPEAHLHPAAQTKVGELIAHSAAMGHSQILVETHSEHLIFGIRIAVKEKIIAAAKTKFLFFDREKNEEGDITSKIDSPLLNNNASFDDWPEGFFDETEKSIYRLL